MICLASPKCDAKLVHYIKQKKSKNILQGNLLFGDSRTVGPKKLSFDISIFFFSFSLYLFFFVRGSIYSLFYLFSIRESFTCSWHLKRGKKFGFELCNCNRGATCIGE